ncbi:Endopolyphosphatase [Choiromyces venosus 120613-1]|uniref:Endopolyphosphatase n=1 Tax=Choiromyces venosus 120613-1 TaxID=1336337 RepID=A0A3N4JH86_9PEZI|nr:Endopolyphosphatase [Choiromyces venosus 120613-1]
MRLSTALTLGFLAVAFVKATPVQNQTPLGPSEVVSVHDAPESQPEPRKLKGRFLHITDIHPDPFYLAGSDPSERCHRGTGEARVLGAETSGCDTPFSLVNETFAWIKENLRDEVDFVIWTGDSARHDNDVNIPRSDSQIFMLNRRITEGMINVFGKPDNLGDDDPTNDLVVPIVPTLGNNDIFPHNIMTDGPNKITREFSDIWRNFIPQDQYHVFDKGAYFWTQVVPGTNGKTGLASKGGLSVISLNTIPSYFFGSNAAVDGCDIKGEPGYQQMEWLKIQLQLMRDIGMKAILIGHVPPAWTSTKQSWDETCWKKYVLWSKQYRDVIVGSIYGHMNLDHFMVHDSDELKPPHDDSKRKKKPKQKSNNPEEMVAYEMDASEFDEENPVFNVQNAESYLNSLREAFSYLPTPIGAVSNSNDDDDSFDENQNADYSQRIGGKWGERYVLSIVGPSVVPNYFPTLRVIEYNITGLDDVNVVIGGSNAKPDDDFQTQATKKRDPSTPDPPSKTAPPGPAYSMQSYTFLGITQYYANLTRINGRKEKEDNQHLELRDSTEDRTFRYELEYDTRTDKIYKLKDMTVKSYLKLAREIVDATRRGNKNKKQGDKDKTQDIDDSAEEWEDLEVEDIEEVDVEECGDVEEEKKKNKKHHHHKLKDRIWHAFVKRAFVGTIEGDEFGV